MCTRSKFSPAIVASAALRPKPPPNGMKGRLLAALLTRGPFLSGSNRRRFFARLGRKMAPPPPAVCMHAAAAALLLPHKGPRGCPGSGGTVRKISSAVALVASKNRDFLPALAPASSQEPNPAAARHHRFLGSQKTARAPRGQYRELMSSSCNYCVRSAPSVTNCGFMQNT